MFRRPMLSALALAFAIGVTGCATNPNNQDVGRIFGTIAGAGVGSLFGNGSGSTLMTIVGGVAGYVIGGNIGRSMDQADQERAGRLAHRGFEQPTPGVYRDSWRNQDGAPVQSQVTTRPYYQDNNGRQCRPFTQETTIRMQGQPQTAVHRGVACFEYPREHPQGIWVVQ